MYRGFSLRHGEVLQELLAETDGSLVIQTDSSGTIEYASSGIEDVGLRLSEMLFKPHIADLTNAAHAEAIRAYHDDTLKGVAPIRHIEFPLTLGVAEPIWYRLSLRALTKEGSPAKGALGLLQSVEKKRVLEGELSNAAMTDATTGLANARAFRAMLAHSLHNDSLCVVAVFELDRFAALKLKFGHHLAEEMLWAFGRFLTNILPADSLIASLDGDRFATLVMDSNGASALNLVDGVLESFEQLSSPTGHSELRLTASAGLAPVEGAIDEVLIQAERALVVARALGGQRAELRADVRRWAAN